MTTKKKPRPAKKPAVKPVVKIAATDSERVIMGEVAKLQDQGYTVQLKCKGRAKMVNPGEDLLEYIRDHSPYEIVGMKSGRPAVCYGIK